MRGWTGRKEGFVVADEPSKSSTVIADPLSLRLINSSIYPSDPETNFLSVSAD